MPNIFKRIKKLKQESKRLEAFEPYETDNEGRRVIRLHIHDDDYFLSQLSVEGVPCIDDDVAYLLNFYLKNMSVDSDEKLHFIISGHNITEEDSQKYRKAIRNYYREEFIDIEDQLKTTKVRSGILTLAGIALLVIIYLIKKNLGDYYLLEVANITSWAAIWEAISLFFDRRPDLIKKQLQNLKILEADFTFIER